MRTAITHTDYQPWIGVLLILLLGLGGCAQTALPETETGESQRLERQGKNNEQPDTKGNAQRHREHVTEEASFRIDETVSPYFRVVPPLPKDVLVRFDQASSLLAQGKQTQAKQILLTLETHCSSCSGVLFNLGLIYRSSGELDSAKHYLHRATQTNGDNLEAWNELGILHRETGDFAAAENCYQQALQRWPSYPEAHLNLAILYELYMGRLSDSLDHYIQYQKLTADDESIDKRERRRLKGWIALLERQLQQSSSSKTEKTALNTMQPVRDMR